MNKNPSKQIASIAYKAMEEKLAQDIRVLDITGVSVLADYFIIASANNGNHVQAVVDFVLEKLGRAGYECGQIEGYQAASWVLLDYKDVVIHVFSKEDRRFYDLDRIWRDAREVEPELLEE